MQAGGADQTGDGKKKYDSVVYKRRIGMPLAQVDKSYVEAAEIDGAGHIAIMFKVMWPQCKGMALVTAINTAIMNSYRADIQYFNE